MRLELTRRGDYAVRAMLALADRNSALPTSGREIAAEMGIPFGFVSRVMGDLVSAGLVESTTGRTGGYILGGPRRRSASSRSSRRSRAKPASELRPPRRPCGRDGHCQVHEAFFAAQDALLEQLRQVTLATGAEPAG